MKTKAIFRTIPILLCLSAHMATLGSSSSLLPEYEGGITSQGGRIQVIGTPDLPSGVISGAISNWSDCGGATPIFSTTVGAASVSVIFNQGNSSSSHAATTQNYIIGGVFQSSIVNLYSHSPAGEQYSTSELSTILTHELGHSLGLEDTTNSECLMGSVQRDASGVMIPKYVSSVECNAVSGNWSIFVPGGIPGDGDCGPLEQKVSTGDCNSPLAIDLGRDGFHFGGPSGGVDFAIYGLAFAPIHIQWVAPEENDGFLFHDLNGNGVVDDGSELFGNGTSLYTQDWKLSTSGYDALSQWDKPELNGNGDNKISQADWIWPELHLWIDLNADGISTENEILLLAEQGITELDLNYKQSYQHDRYGNILRYWSWCSNDQPPPFNRIRMVDVFFKGIP